MISKEQYQEAIKTINEYNSQKDTASFKEGFIKWIVRYFNPKVKILEFENKQTGVFYSRNALYKRYEKAMSESPFI